MMIVAVLTAGMLFRTVGMETVAEGAVSGGDAVPEASESLAPAEGTVSGGDALPVADSEPAESPVAASLEIPQKLSVVLDPWEMDGRGQIYSEPYAIRNSGSVACILRVSFRCVLPEGSGTVIRPEKEGLYGGGGKSIYIEVVFGEDRIVLSQEDSGYEAELAPGESLQVSFSGGMNEEAPEGWRDGDIEIEGTYSWEPAYGTEAPSAGDGSVEGQED